MHDDFDESEMFSANAIGRTPKPIGNPLAAYFRTPGVHVRLPSGGKFLPPGAVEFTAAGDVPVYPMRAADELLMKAPDALMSGYAIEKLIESCVPAIKAPAREITNADLDVLLLAIQAASKGDVMEVQAICPECGEENTFDAHISEILSTLVLPSSDNAVRLNPALIAYVRPYNVGNMTAVSLAAFDSQQTMQALDGHSNEEKIAAANKGMQKLAAIQTQMIAECVIKISTPQGDVVDRNYITAFVNQLAASDSKKLTEKMKELNEYTLDKTLKVKCGKCSHEWTTTVEFDPSNFFGLGS